MRDDPATGPDRAALVADRVAALSRAGLPLSRIWRVLADQQDELSALAETVSGAMAAGRSSASGLRAADPDDPALAWVALACRCAELGGAPLAAVLEAVSAALRADTEAARARQGALAGPRATTTVLTWLPLAGLGLGAAMGVDATAVLVTTPPGWGCLGFGTSLWWAGRRWMTALLRRAEKASVEGSPTDLPAEVLAEVVAALVDAGLPPPGAVQVVQRCLGELDLHSPPPSADLASALHLSERTGVAPGPLLRSAAAERRRRRSAAALVAANRLAVLAVLPTGLCLLPAFVLLTVAPLVLALLLARPS